MLSVLQQIIKERVDWPSDNKAKEAKQNEEKNHQARQRLRTGIVCAGIVMVVAILVMFNYSLIITNVSELMGRCL
jgi:hypothetical protein